MNPYERSPKMNTTLHKKTFQQSPNSNKNIFLKESPSTNILYNRTTTLPSLSPISGLHTARERPNEYYPISTEQYTPRGIIQSPSPPSKKPTYDNPYNGLPMLSPFSPRNEYKESMQRSNIFLGSVPSLNSRITPVNSTPISMLKSLNMINEDQQFDQLMTTNYKKTRKKSKTKTNIKTVLKKVLAKTMGDSDDDEDDTSDRSNHSPDQTILNSSSSPVKQIIRYTEPPPHIRYGNKPYDPYGYSNPVFSPGNNYGPSQRNFQQPMYPPQPMPTNLANNGRKFLHPQGYPNNYPPNMMPQPNGFGPSPYGPYGPMRGFGPGNSYGMQQQQQGGQMVDPLWKVKQAIEEQKRKEAEEEEEADRKKREAADKKRQQLKAQRVLAERKLIAKKRLRAYCWSIAYQHLLKGIVKNIVIHLKKKTMIDVPKKLNNSFEFYKKYIIEWIGRDIKTILEENAFSFIFVQSKLLIKREGHEMSADIKQKLSKNENHSDKCCEYVVKSMKVILDKLISCTKKFPEGFFKMISEITENGSRLPDGYFSFFEICRMQFSHYGALKNIKDWHSKILIGGLVVIRMFLTGIFMQADQLLGIKKDNLQARLLNLGSLIYHVTMDYLKSLAPITKSEVSVEETRVHPITKLQTCLFERDLRYYNIIVGDEKVKNNEIIDGFYPREFFNFFFKERKKMADQLRSLISGWADVVYEYSHETYLKNTSKKDNQDDEERS